MSVSHLLATAPAQPFADAYGLTTDRIWATADGGPETGNGVVGGYAALAIGLIAVVLGGLALTRSRHTVTDPR
jgi:hypothetical protein